MKINILTFHSENNYGANLQAYALSNYCKSIGFKVEFIDFKRRKIDYGNFHEVKKWIGKGVIPTFRKIKDNILEKRKEKKFKEFQFKFLQKSNIRYSSLSDLNQTPPDGDIYIVGSDQVWSRNIISKEDLYVFFLNFGSKNKIRIAYAASSGGEIFSNEDFNEFGHLLDQFQYLGVRENSLRQSIEGSINKKVYLVPDPTFLLDWSLVRKKTIKKSNSLGTFVLKNSNYISFNELLHKSKDFKEGFTTRVNISSKILEPFEWISEIESCSLIVTDSYHCVLFCLYTNTPFIFVKWGNDFYRDNRVMEVLEKFGLLKNAIFPKATVKLQNPDFYLINWDEINRIVVEERNKGIEFLKLCILNNLV